MLFIFDMGGVVTNTFKFDRIYNKLNLTKESFFQICKNTQNDIWHDLTIGKITTNKFWSEFNDRAKNNNVPRVDHDLFKLYFHPSKITETVNLIQNLKQKNRVVCGTNTIDSHWETHMERGDYAFFHQTYASNKIGAAKPDASFFKLILDAEGYDAKDAFFTDDREENCEAARSVGINAVLFTSAEDLCSQWKKYC